MIFETHPSLMAYELISAIVLTLIAIFAFNLMDPEHGTSHQRRLDTAFGPQIITVFRPYFGRKKCEVTGGIIEAAEPGKVVDLDASYGPCRRWGGTWDQRWEPALLVLDF